MRTKGLSVLIASAFIIQFSVLYAKPIPMAEPRELPTDKPAPDIAHVHYGPHERQVLDLWKAKATEPAPLVIFFHGGGFVGGNKTNLSPGLLDMCLQNGISVASSNYRYSTQAPFPGPMHDGARAIRFLRLHAKEWNLDPARFAGIGDSAGAGITLWVGFHDDMAKPGSADPVEQQSTRLRCMATVGGQCSYDLRFIRQQIGGRAYEHPALPKLYGIQPGEVDSPRAFELYEQAAPINYVSAGDPPAFLYYSEPREPLPPGPNSGPTLFYPEFGKEIPGQQHPGQGIHHPKFGEILKEKLDAVGVECVLRHQVDYESAKSAITRPMDMAHREMVQFFLNHF